MLEAFKANVLPYVVYLSVWLAVFVALARRAEVAAWLYAILAPLPTLWYPSQFLPLASSSLTLLIAAALLGGWLRRASDDPRSANGGYLLLYILASYLYLWNTTLRFHLPPALSADNPEFAYWKNFAAMILGYYVTYLTLRTESHIRTLLMIVFAVLLFLVWREVASFTSGSAFSYGQRSNGPFWLVGLGANHFGAFIAHYAVLALAMFVADRNRLRRAYYAVTFAGSLYPLFFSYSRGAYAAAVAALGLIGALRSRLVLASVVVLLATWQSVLPSSVVDRIQMTETSSGELEDSAAERVVMWDLAKKLFAGHPVAGIGFQGFYFASEGQPLRNVHNYYYETAAEEGVIGLALLGWLFLRALASGWALYRRGGSEFLRAFGLGFLATTVAVMVSNVFGDRFSQIELGSYFFLLFGAVDRARHLGATAQAPAGEAGALRGAAPGAAAAQA
jgi:O-antigen ligase